MKRIVTLIFLWFVSLSFVAAQNKSNPYTISLKAGNITLPENAKSFVDSITIHGVRDELQVLIQFYELPNAAQRALLKAHNITLSDYLSGNAYTAFISPSSLNNLPLTNIRSIALMQPQWKMEARVKQLVLLTTNKKYKLGVSFNKQITKEEIRKILSRHGATIIHTKFAAQNVYEIELPNTVINALANELYVTYISMAAKDVSLNNDERAITNTNYVHNTLGLDGTGITVGVGDNSTSLFHTDVRDRVTNFNPDPPELHGQHTSGTVAGKGILDPNGKGMAPNAALLNHLYNVVWAQTQPMFTDYNMTLTNNSYAAVVNDCAVAGTYDNYSQMLDDLAHQFPQVLNVFAAGNDGQKDCPSYPTGYGTVCGIYQTAKNVLTIGSMRKNYTNHEESSMGPVKDGRLKPEVISIGADLYSTALYDNYVGMTGTSMACPGATGALALLSQRYKQLNGNNNAPNALLKALIMNGATDVGNTGPDYKYGFGLINLYRSLEILNNNRVQNNTISQNGSQIYTINVPANTVQLKVLLYWNDAAASPSSSIALVNNLDFTVIEPNNNLHHPLVLDPTPGNVTNLAIEATDNLNNAEQVVINNPQQGNYTLEVKGSAIPSASQEYYLVYDFVPQGLMIKYPTTDMIVPANEPVNVYWDASDDPNNLTLEYSLNNGSTWTVIDNNIAAAQKYYTWGVPNVSTHTALLRLKRNNTSTQTTSGQFTINPQPVLQLDAAQCPGYFGFNWNTISNATGYQILRKIGDDLQAIDTVTAANYLLKGLPLNEMQYVAVTPLINGKPGYRSKALTRLPNDGTCADAMSDNDLTIENVTIPSSGRKFTSTELSANETMHVVVRNLDDAPNNNHKVSYKVNGNTWLSQNFTANLPANSTANISLSGLNLSAVNTYQIIVAVENLSANDPVKANDTFYFTVKQLANDPVDITNVYTEDFESAGKLTVMKDEMGVLPGDHWDYTNSTDSGRLRTFVESDVTISGQRSLSMDLLYSLPDNRNYLYGTFNLGSYNIAGTEARLEFDYKLHGISKFQEGNDVYVRGNDMQPWVKLTDMDTNIGEGVTIKTGSLSITDALANAGQDFSASFQVRIGQHDTSAIAANEYGNGLTIDNFKLYNVKNDVQLLSILNPEKLNCGSSSSEPVTVKIYNSDNLGQSNIQLFYRFDNGAVVTQTLDTLAPKGTVDFTFTQPVGPAAIGYHQLDVWLSATGDTYLQNDSILNYHIRNQPVVTAYPYLENFEAGAGNWFSEGNNNSWGYGTLASVKINKAASGNKAWKTNPDGKHNDNETAYLYSPCYDLSNLSNPVLSFSLATDIENCGNELCDRAYMEYSEDGVNWTKLGAANEGTNWYNDADHQVWNEQDNVRWRVASISLPQSSSLKLRFVFRSDPGASREGIAIDDIHIFDLNYPLYDIETAYSASAEGSNTEDFVTEGKILAQVFSTGQSSGTANVSAYFHRNAYHPLFHQYFLTRNYAIHTAAPPSDEVILRLYITDDEVLKMLNDNSCEDCEKAENAYRLGILKYSDEPSKENGSLLDNDKDAYSFIQNSSVNWVPYDRGYYAEIKTNSLSEFWFTTSIPQRKILSTVFFPNPVTDSKLNAAWHGKPSDHLELRIYDAIGKLVYSAEAAAEDTDNLTTFLLPQLSNGVYVAKYKTALESGEVKVVVK